MTHYRKLWTLTVAGLTPLFLLGWRRRLVVPLVAASLLAGCATPSNGPEIVERTVYVGLPTTLLKDCTRVDLGALRTNGDMAKALVEQDASLASCNADKAAIRQLQPDEVIPDSSEGE